VTTHHQQAALTKSPLAPGPLNRGQGVRGSGMRVPFPLKAPPKNLRVNPWLKTTPAAVIGLQVTGPIGPIRPIKHPTRPTPPAWPYPFLVQTPSHPPPLRLSVAIRVHPWLKNHHHPHPWPAFVCALPGDTPLSRPGAASMPAAGDTPLCTDFTKCPLAFIRVHQWCKKTPPDPSRTTDIQEPLCVSLRGFAASRESNSPQRPTARHQTLPGVDAAR
jgi:hypothetical protein